MEFHSLVAAQKGYFNTNATLSYVFRLAQLKKLDALIKKYEAQIIAAIISDLHKPEFEAWGTEIGVVNYELQYYIRKLKKWMRPKKIATPLFHFRSRSFIQPIPYGNTLIIAPWNYPFLLVIRPLLGAIAAGNTAIIKPSEQAPATAAIIAKIINENFDSHYLYVANTDIPGSKILLEQKFDYIFFTGGSIVGKIVYQSAAKHLTPVTLELGGKNPCIIDDTANIKIATARITWGKFSNNGQTCVAPDYLLVHENCYQEVIQTISNNINQYYGTNIRNNKDYGRIVNQHHFNRIHTLIQNEKIIMGGDVDATNNFISPTLIEVTDVSSPIMQEEIFGPVLPIIKFKSHEEIPSIIQRNPDPLVLYIYSKNAAFIKKCTKEIGCGDMVVNESVLHFGDLFMPVGGKGSSGIGKSQGRASFDTFSHQKSILKKKFLPELPVRYPPYTAGKQKWIKILFKYLFNR